MNAKVIAIVIQKGGVGKTITFASLGIGLAQENKKVLQIDNDPQGAATRAEVATMLQRFITRIENFN